MKKLLALLLACWLSGAGPLFAGGISQPGSGGSGVIDPGSVGATEIDETDDYTWTGDHVFEGGLDLSAATITGIDATEVPYTPAVGGNWDDPDPEDVSSALDALAAQSKFTTESAGEPGATDCLSTSHFINDTSTPELYFCPGGASSTPVKAHAQSLGLAQVNGDSGSVTMAAGGTTMSLVTGDGLTITCGTTTCTVALDNHVKSIYFPANSLTTDGTQCASPALATINSGWRGWTILCADNDGSTIYGHVVMPDSWNAGTVTFELEYVQTAANTSALNSDIAAACRSAGTTLNNTWGTEIAIDDAAVSGSNIVDHTTSTAVTPNGTCAAGDSLFFRWQLDATGTTTAVATLHILGVKMEYGILRTGSD